MAVPIDPALAYVVRAPGATENLPLDEYRSGPWLRPGDWICPLAHAGRAQGALLHSISENGAGDSTRPVGS